ncbi:LysR family transcriptional regulator [Sphingobium sp. DEHP117]|uniref:LysR family transcriptional regulator n=1 Tax=Sphingobium sp. DEHP117 TaxID=2993436 RepID=UPI0027D631A1|nr:LysR substrate-binding domain-containing protein [Sphingobium sp. DEHP117]MDQ4420137.1 LysR family transcriptional regulator [Sphingobium sp. DEHP117]
MTVWDFNLRHLRAVAKIGQFGTMNAAAQAVNLSQPAITQALSQIENMLGVTLFERRHNGMTQTPAAAVFLPRVEAALAHIASPHVTMSRFRALIALADAGSYIGAAQAARLASPSLHRAVSDLALVLRCTLVERRGKMVRLTQTGTRLARAFRLAKVELETGLAELEALKGHETRSISVGAMPLSRARVLPAAVIGFLKARPQVRISIVEGSRAELVEPLRNGALDMMIGAQRDPLMEPDLLERALFRDRLIVIARKGHALDGTAANMKDLVNFPWVIAASGAPLRALWQTMFERHGLPLPAVPIESGSMMTIRQLLMDSDMLTLASPDQVKVELEAGWLARIMDLPADLGRNIALTTRASWTPTEVHAEFVACLERAVAG